MVVLWIPGWWPRHQPGRPAGLLPSSPPRPGSYTRLLAGPARVAAPPPVPGQRPLALGQLVVECGQPRPATLRSAAPPPARPPRRPPRLLPAPARACLARSSAPPRSRRHPLAPQQARDGARPAPPRPARTSPPSPGPRPSPLPHACHPAAAPSPPACWPRGTERACLERWWRALYTGRGVRSRPPRGDLSAVLTRTASQSRADYSHGYTCKENIVQSINHKVEIYSY